MNIDAPPPASFDLYAVLGIDRTATKAEIHSAYREKAKVFHPDVPETGDKTVFQQLQTARTILTNPRSRDNYDKIGVIEPDQADNEIANLMTTATGIFGQVMHAVLSAQKSPSRGDFMGAVHKAINTGFEQVNKAIEQLEQSKIELAPMPGRFKITNFELPNLLNMVAEGQMAQLDKQIEGNRAQLRQLEAFRQYLVNANVTFEKAP